MTEKKPFQSFINLIDFDQIIAGHTKELSDLNRKKSELEAQRTLSEKQSEEQKLVVKNARKEVDEHELTMKEFESAEKDAKNRLESATDQKVYTAFKKEIDRLKLAQHEHEEVLMQSWNKAETAEKRLQEMQQVSKQYQEALEKQINELDVHIQEKKDALALFEKSRDEKVAQVPQEWLDNYAMMRAQVPDPVVPVESLSCSACFTAIAQQDMTALRHKKLLKCKGCFRILYLPELMNDKESNATNEQTVKSLD